jgi:hypothetical protein
MTEIVTGTLMMIDHALSEAAREEEPRKYLGASVIGEECHRKLWYSFHKPKPILDPRVNRIFRLGNLIEDEIISILRLAGFNVYTEQENGEQFGFIDGPIAGHIDGVITGLPESSKPHLLELKSAKDKSWKEFVKEGYQKDSKYMAQVQIYMRKMGLERALVIVYNKDTSELYLERIKLKKRHADALISKGKAIAEMDNEPPRQYSSKTFFKCRWCDWNKECWGDE